MITETGLIIMKTEDGKYLVASRQSPRFCVAGNSVEEALLIAARAIAFYEKYQVDRAPSCDAEKVANA